MKHVGICKAKVTARVILVTERQEVLNGYAVVRSFYL